MKPFRFYTFSLIVLFALFIGCSDDDTPEVPQSAIDKALALIPGTVSETESETEEGVATWKVEISTASGAEVEVYCRQDNGALFRIDGETPPFDYDIDPGNSLLTFSQALAIAEAQVTESLDEWRLRMEDKYDDTWVYTFEFTNTGVFIDASDGSILDIEN